MKMSPKILYNQMIFTFIYKLKMSFQNPFAKNEIRDIPEGLFEKTLQKYPLFPTEGFTLFPNRENVNMYSTMNDHDKVEILASVKNWRYAQIIAIANPKFDLIYDRDETQKYIYFKTRKYAHNWEFQSKFYLGGKNRKIRDAYWEKTRHPEIFDNLMTPEAFADIWIKNSSLNVPITDEYIILNTHLPQISAADYTSIKVPKCNGDCVINRMYDHMCLC